MKVGREPIFKAAFVGRRRKRASLNLIGRMPMHWLILNRAPLTNILGVIFDLVGAYLVAFEVVRKFRGRPFADSFTFDESVQLAPQPTEEHRQWELRKFTYMKWGLALLTVGFVLQLIANVLQLKCEL
jgi:hypothetical protein